MTNELYQPPVSLCFNICLEMLNNPSVSVTASSIVVDDDGTFPPNTTIQLPFKPSVNPIIFVQMIFINEHFGIIACNTT